MDIYEEIVERLIEKGMTISTMESCTGGAVADEITTIPGASDVLKFSAVTYSNEYKIKMGVEKDIIDKYSVYSFETAKNMSKKITDFTNSDYGIGVTGKINKLNKSNPFGENNIIYISIYDKNKDVYITEKIEATYQTRRENKMKVVKIIGDKLLEII